MKHTKRFAKILLIIHILSGVWMVSKGLYDSFSQHSTSTNDWALRIYLISGAWLFLTLMSSAKRKHEFLHVSWVKIKHWHIWFLIAVCFAGVSTTNVIDYSLADPNDTDPTKVFLHYLFTGLLAASATFFSWHYYPKKTESRSLAMTACLTGAISFGLSVLFTRLGFSFLSISIGELIISTAISFVVWPVINEQLN